MAESATERELFWVDPVRRGILPLDRFHVPSRLRRDGSQRPLRHTLQQRIRGGHAGCAESTSDRPQTWINDEIIALYTALFRRGAAHCVECWADGVLAGGLYGVQLGAAFFG